MPPATPQAVSVAMLMLAWALLAVMLVNARIRARRSADGAGATRKRDLVSWAGLALQGAGFAFAWSSGRPAGTPWLVGGGVAGDWAVAVGAGILALASAFLAGAALRTLDKQWSLTARVRGDHELVQSGPFALVRHPIYTALLGLLVATALCFARPWALVAGTALYLVGTHWRAAREEALLAETFGAVYASYRARVPRLLPWPSRLRG